MKKRLLVICGPTATGKTSLALGLADKFDGELISADSRQFYRNMNIGTGKEVPEGFKFRISDLEFKDFNVGYYSDGKIRLWGYDLVELTQDFSVALFAKIANKIIDNISLRGKLPILVGGTGLYIKGVVDGIPSLDIPKDDSLRSSLENKKSDELFEILAGIDPVKSASMNASDRKNPRRLIRAIEIAKFKSHQKDNWLLADIMIKNQGYDVLFVGLTAPKAILDKKIEERVKKRLAQGFEKEVRKLLSQGVKWSNQSMQTLGYMQFRDYFEGKITLNQATDNWITAERQYARRQMTWFKKEKRIKWYDISKEEWSKDIEKLVRKWHNRENKN